MTRHLFAFIFCFLLVSPAFAAPQDCTAAYKDALKADANNLAALNGRALCMNMVEQGSGDADLKKAIEISTAQIKADDKNAEAYYSRATSYRVLKDYKKAKEDYARAVALKPDNQLWAADAESLAKQRAQPIQTTSKP